MANVYSVAFSVLGVVGMHTCLLLWTALLLPGPVERASQRIATRPTSSFFAGVLVCGITAILVSGFLLLRSGNVPRIEDLLTFLADKFQVTRFYNDTWIITNALLWLLAAPVMVGFVVGGAGFARLFAERARPLMRDDRPLVGLALGALCTSAAYFLPLVGWFVYLPVVGMMSIGAGACGILTKSPARVAETRYAASPASGAEVSPTR